MAALSRMANRDHRHRASARATPSSSPRSLIPGNENAVYRVINGLMHARRQRRAQGQRQGARLRPRQRRRAALLLQHRQAAATSCRCTASGATSSPTPSSPSPPACPRDRMVARRGRRGGRPRRRPGRDRRRGAVRLRLRRRLLRRRRHRGAAQGPPDPAATRASSPSSSCVDAATGKVVAGPEIHGARLRRGRRRSSTQVRPADRAGARPRPPRDGRHRLLRAAAGRPPHRRRLGQRQATAAAR